MLKMQVTKMQTSLHIHRVRDMESAVNESAVDI